MSEFLVVLQIMPRRVRSKGDWGRAPLYASSHGDSSSDDEIVSASKQVARVLKRHFDRKGYDIMPTSGIPMETRPRRRH